MPPLLLSLLVLIGLALVGLGLYLPRSGPDPLAERLLGLHQRSMTLEELDLHQPFGERILRPFIRRLARDVDKLQEQRRQTRRSTGRQSPDEKWEAIQVKLAVAGNPYNWAPNDYLGTKIFAAGGIGAGLFLLMTLGHQPVFALVFLAVGGALGWFGPDLLLRSKTQARQKEIQLSLADALDLLVISVEAGLGFDAAIQRLVDKKDNQLTREFARVLAELRVGRSRRDALRDMVLRTQVPDLSNFVGALLQAESLGVSVTRVLTVQADQMRTMRRQRAEESAAKLQLKMLFPLAFFIFPALCVVIIGPIWPQVASANAPGL